MRRLITLLLPLMFIVAAVPSSAASVPELPQQAPPWKIYFPVFFGPNNDVVRPVRVTRTSGQVVNAGALVGSATGSAVLTGLPGGPPAPIAPDYGRAARGVPFMTGSGRS